MESIKNVAITGGGTGGHLSIAKALAKECKRRGFYVIYIGSTSGQDRSWFENSDIFSETYFLDSTGVVNKRGFGLIKSMWLQCGAILKSRKILRKHKIDFVISVGGFSAGGGSMAAILCKIPLFIHEQNSIFGTLNKVLAPFANAVFGSFKIHIKNFIQTAYPIDEIYHKNARIRQKIEVILFLGGSQGALAINDFALNIAPKLLQRNIKIIHQCGKNNLNRLQNAYKDLMKDDNIILFDFSKDLHLWVEKADFCVTRSGASSLWEMCANYLPCYFVPYPYAAKNHQFHNAMFLKNQNLCEVVEQKDLDSDTFLAYLDAVNVATISKNLANLAYKNGSSEIIDLIVDRI